MPVGRNCCYKKSVSADRKFYLLVRFFMHSREKIQVITSDCAEKESTRFFFKTGSKGQIMRFYLLQKPGFRYEGITVLEIIL